MKINFQSITIEWKTLITWLAVIVGATCAFTFTGMQMIHSYATDDLKKEIKELRVLGGMDIKDLAVKLGENAKKLRITVDEQRLLEEQRKSIGELEKNLELAQESLKNKISEIKKLTNDLVALKQKYKVIIGNSNFIDAEFKEDKTYEIFPNDIFINISSIYSDFISISSPQPMQLTAGISTVFNGKKASCTFRFLERKGFDSVKVRYKCNPYKLK